jgi:hypothetical protein
MHASSFASVCVCTRPDTDTFVCLTAMPLCVSAAAINTTFLRNRPARSTNTQGTDSHIQPELDHASVPAVAWTAMQGRRQIWHLHQQEQPLVFLLCSSRLTHKFGLTRLAPRIMIVIAQELREDALPENWSRELELAVLEGSPLFRECYLLHRASKTVFSIDSFNMIAEEHTASRYVCKCCCDNLCACISTPVCTSASRRILLITPAAPYLLCFLIVILQRGEGGNAGTRHV